MKVCCLALVNAHIPSCIWNVRAEGLTFSNVKQCCCEKALKYSAGLPWHTSALCPHNSPHAVFTNSVYGNTDAFEYWYGNMFQADRLFNYPTRLQQKMQWKVFRWPALQRDINATWSICQGSDYKGKIVFQITHLSLRFTETMQVFSRVIPNVFLRWSQGIFF